MKVRLEVAHSKANVKRVVLTRDAVIGRSPDCNLRIAAGQVSRRHCTMLVSDRGVFVRDHGSSNGTYLADQRLEPNVDVPVPPGSRLNIGGVRFLVKYELAGMLAAGDGSTVHRAVGDTLEPGPSPVAGDDVVAIDEGADTADVTATKGPTPADLSDDAATLSDEALASDIYDEDSDAVFDFEDDDELTAADPEEPTVDVPALSPETKVPVNRPSDFAADIVTDAVEEDAPTFVMTPDEEDGSDDDSDLDQFLGNLD